MRITIGIPDGLIERAVRTRDLRVERAAVAMALEQVANKAKARGVDQAHRHLQD